MTIRSQMLRYGQSVSVMKTPVLLLSTFLMLVAASCRPSDRNEPVVSVAPTATATDAVYVADKVGRVRAFGLDGTERWSVSLGDEISRLNGRDSRDIQIEYLAAEQDGKLFGLAAQLTGEHKGDSYLFALSGNRIVWQRTVPYPAQGVAPLAVGQTAVYLAADNGTLSAFARVDGNPLWEYRVSRGALGSPAVGADGTIYVAGADHNLHAVGTDGKPRWVVKTQP
jgi:outer membrane protein assembly factor BamB